MNNDKFRDYILAKIDEIHESKKGKVTPTHVTLNEISGALHNELRNELNAMFKEGIIKVGNTINGKYIINNKWNEEV